MKSIALFAAIFSALIGVQAVAVGDADGQALYGFARDAVELDFVRFRYQDHGTFLISKSGFFKRRDAMTFCNLHPGYELSDWLLPMVISFIDFPFAEIRQENVIDVPALGGNQTPSGKPRTGAIFWIKGKTASEEAQLSERADSVYELLKGCGPNCDGFESLARVNAKLEFFNRTPRSPRAVCVSHKLKAHFAR